MGRSPVRDNKGTEGIGFSKKRMPICNGLDRGSNFALIRKDADLLAWYFHVKMDANL